MVAFHCQICIIIRNESQRVYSINTWISSDLYKELSLIMFKPCLVNLFRFCRMADSVKNQCLFQLRWNRHTLTSKFGDLNYGPTTPHRYEHLLRTVCSTGPKKANLFIIPSSSGPTLAPLTWDERSIKFFSLFLVQKSACLYTLL